jgi:Fe-S cluster biogenesis protein NfuA
MNIESQQPRREAIEAELDRLRPGLIADGGNVELVDVGEDGTVRLELQGACKTCPAQVATLRVGIEDPLRKAVAGISAVVSV